MDLYRYFHPHHNPRLKHSPLRLVELSELLQASIELKRAVQRAEIRAGNAPCGAIESEHFDDALVALEYVVETLQTLARAHPGDHFDGMTQLLKERQHAPGWENWTRLLRERLNILEQYEYEFNRESSLRLVSSK